MIGSLGSSRSRFIDGKRLELLKELVPRVSRVAVLWNPANPNNAARLKGMQAAAQALRLTLEPVVGAADGQQLDRASERSSRPRLRR